MRCFGGYTNELTIYEMQGKVMAILDHSDEKKQTIELSKEQLGYFNSFASELKNLEGGGLCTTPGEIIQPSNF